MDESLGFIVKLVFGVLCTLLIVVVILPKFFGVVSAESAAGASTTQKFLELANAMKEYDTPAWSADAIAKAYAGTGELPSSFVALFTLEDGFIFAGFDSDTTTLADSCTSRQLTRPSSCPFGKACLCMCLENRGCDDYANCRVFDQVKRIGTPRSDKNFLGLQKTGSQGNNLLVYGKCGSQFTPSLLYVYPIPGAERTILVADVKPSR